MIVRASAMRHAPTIFVKFEAEAEKEGKWANEGSRLVSIGRCFSLDTTHMFCFQNRRLISSYRSDIRDARNDVCTRARFPLALVNGQRVRRGNARSVNVCVRREKKKEFSFRFCFSRYTPPCDQHPISARE